MSRIEIEKDEYTDNYECEVWDHRHGEYGMTKYKANTLEDVFDLLRQTFIGEPQQRGLNKVEEEDR